MEGNATLRNKKQEEDQLSSAHTEFGLPQEGGYASGNVPKQPDGQCREPPTWAGDIYLKGGAVMCL